MTNSSQCHEPFNKVTHINHWRCSVRTMTKYHVSIGGFESKVKQSQQIFTVHKPTGLSRIVMLFPTKCVKYIDFYKDLGSHRHPKVG